MPPTFLVKTGKSASIWQPRWGFHLDVSRASVHCQQRRLLVQMGVGELEGWRVTHVSAFFSRSPNSLRRASMKLGN